MARCLLASPTRRCDRVTTQQLPYRPRKVISLDDTRCKRVDRARGTLREAWDVYVAALELQKLRPASQYVYRQAAREALAALPERPTAGDVRVWLEAMVRDGAASATVNKKLRAMKSITERAALIQRSGDLGLRNAFKAQRPYRIEHRPRRDAPEDTVRRLLTLAATPFERLAVRLAAFYGLRRAEILGLRPEDVRHDYGTMRVGVERQRSKFGIGKRKNSLNGKAHVLTVDDGETAGLLTSLVRTDTRMSLVDGRQRELAREWLIPWGCDHMQALMARWRRDPGVHLPKGDGWHALRHYGATVIASLPGRTTTDVQAWLGDSTATAAMTYMGQVRGTTVGTGACIVRAFEGRGKEMAREVDGREGGVTPADTGVTPNTTGRTEF